jgi:hypothetical protein
MRLQRLVIELALGRSELTSPSLTYILPLDHNLEPCTFTAPIRAIAPPLRKHFFCPRLNRVFQVFFHERL